MSRTKHNGAHILQILYLGVGLKKYTTKLDSIHYEKFMCKTKTNCTQMEVLKYKTYMYRYM